jgi:L-iditol 2-dehydrogenase
MLVIGLGVMGLIHVLLAREFGVKSIIGADMNSFRLNKAREFGADHVIDVSKQNLRQTVLDITGGVMARTAVVCPNSVEAMRQGFGAVASGGTIMFFTPAKPGETLTIDPNELYFRDIRISTSYSCGPDDTKRALEFIRRRIVTADKVITNWFGIEGTEKAYKLTSEAGDSLKSIIIF